MLTSSFYKPAKLYFANKDTSKSGLFIITISSPGTRINSNDLKSALTCPYQERS
jgi:hypothetical protein